MMMHRIALFAPQHAEYAIRLAGALAQRATVLLVVRRADRIAECGEGIPPRDSGRLRIVEYDGSTPFDRPTSLLRILWHLVRFRPSMVNIQGEDGVFTPWLARLVRPFCPILLTVHDPRTRPEAVGQPEGRAHRLVRSMASAFHVHGHYSRSLLLPSVGGGRPMLRTAHGIVHVPDPAARKAPEPIRILMFGPMEADGGLDVLLDAADRLRESGVAFRLVLAGRGSELDRLSARLAGAPDIEVLDRILPPAEAVEQFQWAAGVVLPALDAAQNDVVAAAFGNGRPVIASRTGSLADAVKDGVDGLLVPADDPDSLADALQLFLTSETMRASLSAGASRAAETDLAWPSIADAMLAFIDANGLTTGRGR